MSHQRLTLVLLFLIPLIFVSFQAFSVGDLSVWIAHGLYFLRHHEILRQDVFSVLPTQPLVYPSFGISVLYALLYPYLGLSGVCFLHAIFVLPVILYLIYEQSIFNLKQPYSKKVRFSIFIVWLSTVSLFCERPSMIAIIPLLLSFKVITGIKDEFSPKQLLQLGLINLIWANIHGSFILLPLLLGWKLFWLSLKRFKIRPWFFWALILSTSFLNPFGEKIFPYILETARVSRLREISEWVAPKLLTPYFPVGLLYWSLLICIGVLIYRRSKQEQFVRFLSHPFFPVLILGMASIRNAGLSFILLLPFLYSIGYFDQKETETFLETPKKNQLTFVFFALLFVLSLSWIRVPLLQNLGMDKASAYDETATFKISHFIQSSGRTCPIFNAWELGSFFMLELPNRIFIDTRNIIYGET